MMSKILRFFYSLRQRWFPTLIVISATLLIVAGILRLITPQTPVIQRTNFITQNFNDSKSSFRNITYTGETLSLPEQVAVATVEDLALQSTLIEQQLILNLKMDNSPTNPDLFIGPQYSMIKVPAENKFLLSQNESAATVSSPLSKTEATAIAQTFLAQHLPKTPLLPQKNGVQVFLSLSEDYNPSDADQGALIKIPFAYELNGIPIFYENTSSYPFEVLVDSNRAVQKFTFYTQFVNVQPGIELPPISINQAVQNINNDQASIISTQTEAFGPLRLESISSGELKTVQLEYRIDSNIGTVYPFYRFSGTVKNIEGDTLQVEILTPAVATSE